MTAGREQDARETLRALSEAATPGPWGVDPTPEFQHRIRSAGHEPSWVLGDHVADAVFDPDAAFIAAAVNYVRAALLPSPPATTPCPTCGGARSVNDKGEWSCYGECGGYGILPDPSPPATTGAGRCSRCGHAFHEHPCLNMASDNDCSCPASPPATDGDAADGGTR